MSASSSIALERPSSPDALSVLALHGFTGGGLDFDPLVEALPELTWRAPNLPGHASDLAAPGAPSDDSSLPASLRYLDSLPPPSPGTSEILLGYSLGGRLALRYALTHPHRFAGLILIATSPGLTEPAARATRRIDDETLAQFILEHGIPAFLEKWQSQPLIATQSRLPALWRAAMHEHRLQLRPAGLAASLRNFGQAALDPVWENLRQLPMPVLLVAGMDDPRYARLAATMQRDLPAAEMFLVPNAGHMAHLENLPPFAVGLRQFLARRQLASSPSS